MSVIVQAGSTDSFFLEAGARFDIQGPCEVLVNRWGAKFRVKIGSSEQQVGPFLSDAQINLIATSETTYTVHPAEVWAIPSVLAGTGGAEQIGTSSGSTVQQALDDIESTLDFSELAAATTPVDDADLMMIRQGTTNAKIDAGTFRTEFATDAVIAQTAAETAEANAEAAQAAAEAARDTAFTNADVYDDTTAGLAAVSLNGQFQVIVGEDSVRYREDSGPVATEVARYPTANKVLPAVARAVPWLKVVDDLAGGWKVPRFQYEEDLGLIWINGRVTTVAAGMTDNGDGSFTVNEVPLLPNGVTMAFEWSRDGHSGTPSGYYCGMASHLTASTSEVAAEATWLSGPAVIGFKTANRVPVSIQQTTINRWGSTFGIMSVPSSGNAAYQTEAGTITAGAAANAWVQPIRLNIGGRVAATRLPLTNASVTRVVIYDGGFTDAQIAELEAAMDRYPAPEVQLYPHWLAVIPRGDGSYFVPSFQFDPVRERCWYNGAERAIADVLTDNGDGSWTMKKPPRGLTASSGVTVACDFMPTTYYTHVARPSGITFFACLVTSGTAGLSHRLQMGVNASGPTSGASETFPGGLIGSSGYSTAISNNFGAQAGVRPSELGGEAGGMRGQGILRNAVTCPVSGSLITCLNGFPARVSSAGTASSYTPQDYWRFGALYDGTSVLTNCALQQVIIYSETMTADELSAVGRFNEYRLPPLFLWGDSFNNQAQPADMLRLHLAAQGCTYLPTMSDGLGSRGLSFHAEAIPLWLDDYDQLRDYLLVMVEGGFDLSSLAVDGVTTVGPYSRRDVLTYIETIFDEFREPRKIYMEGHSNIFNGTDTVGYAKFVEDMAAIKDTFPDAYTPLNALLQSRAASDADFLAFRADGRTPAALTATGGAGDVHPGWGTAYAGADSGYYWLSLALLRKLASLGWNPTKPLA